MRVLAVRGNSVGTISSSTETLLRRRKSRWAGCLFISSLSAMFTGVTGLTFGGLSLLHVTGISNSLQTICTLLIAVTFPLMAVVAHCLDKIDRVDQELRSERCLRHGSADMD